MGAASIKCTRMEPIKILVIVVLFAIVGSLGSALFHLSRGKGEEDSRKMARALTVRIGLSLALFILLMLAWYAGLIKPTGAPLAEKAPEFRRFLLYAGRRSAMFRPP